MNQAIGIVETRGLVSAIEAADTMLKTADVHILEVNYVGSAVISVIITGDVSSVKSAVVNGNKAAEEIGEVISCNVIAKPNEEVDKIFSPDIMR